jgi:hypothetical protein
MIRALAKIIRLMEQFSLEFPLVNPAMNLQSALVVFLLIAGPSLAPAQENNISPSSDEQAFAPVNRSTRFLLSSTLPHLAEGLTGSVENRVILRAGEFQQEDQSIITHVPQARGKHEAWVQMNNYWIEPVTPPPSQGETAIVPIDDMRVAEVQGEVTLTEFTTKLTKAKPIEVNEDMEVPEASTLSTADTGSAAILVGGHTSIRLVPNSRAQFHYDVSGSTPRLEVTILRGAAFCKVGKLPNGHVPDVGMRGLVGSAANIGSSDFFVQTDPVSLHVCLVRGRLLFGDTIPLAVGNMEWYPSDAEATATSGPRICHWPKPTSEAKNLMDDRVLGFALHQADNLNVKIKALLSSTTTPLSSDDQAYLAQIPRITWYAQAAAFP